MTKLTVKMIKRGDGRERAGSGNFERALMTKNCPSTASVIGMGDSTGPKRINQFAGGRTFFAARALRDLARSRKRVKISEVMRCALAEGDGLAARGRGSERLIEKAETGSGGSRERAGMFA